MKKENNSGKNGTGGNSKQEFRDDSALVAQYDYAMLNN